MTHRDEHDPKLDELSPKYDHYVDEALDYANDRLLPEDAVAFRERMKSDEMFRRVVAPVLGAHEGPRSAPVEIRSSWADLRSRIAAAGGTPPALEAIDQALAAPATTYEQRVKARSRANWGTIMRFAAVFAFLMALPIALVTYYRYAEIERIETPSNVVSDVVLPDRSTIRLQPGARIEYARDFMSKRIRRVVIRGEGEFTVAPDRKQQFVVQTERAQITAIGTRFTVRADEEATVVTVSEGVVLVGWAGEKSGSGSGITGLKAGGRVRVTRNGVFNELPGGGGTP